MNVNAKPSSTFKLEAVHPDPSQAHKMPYAPAIKIVGACDLMFLSGATASPLYHNHPHQDHEHVHPHSIEQQTKNAMDAIKSILDSQGATWRDVIKVTKYLTDFREADAMHKTMAAYFGDWLPASTTVCINQLSSPGRADRARHDRGAAEIGGEVACVKSPRLMRGVRRSRRRSRRMADTTVLQPSRCEQARAMTTRVERSRLANYSAAWTCGFFFAQ